MIENNASQPVQYASFNLRILAVAIDLFLIALLIAPIMNPLSHLIMDKDMAMILEELSAENIDNVPLSGSMIFARLHAEHFFEKYFLIQGVTFGLMSIYFVGSWIYAGATPGKWLVGCKIVDSKSLEKLTYSQAMLRWLAYILSLLPLGLGFAMMIFSATKRGLHDYIAGTQVIKCRHDFSRFESWRKKIFK